MAFTGLNVTFGYFLVSSDYNANGPGASNAIGPLYGPMTSSQSPASQVISTAAAPVPGNPKTQFPMASVHAVVDSWITVGPNPPDPSGDSPQGGRRFIPAYTTIAGDVSFLCNAGDKIRWVAA